MPQAREIYSQHRRWLKTHFKLGPRKLDYSIASKQENSLEESVGFDALGAPSTYVTTVEPDRDLRWILFLMSGLALFAAFRANAHPLLLIGIYGGVTALAVLGLWLTRRWRSVGYTSVPAGTLNVLVLADHQHDEILNRLEMRRVEALRRGLEDSRGLTLRTHLRRLRWLVDNGAMSRDEFSERQIALLPNESLLPEAAPESDPVKFSQRRLTTRIDLTLEATRLVYSRHTMFEGSERFSIDYANLREGGRNEETDKQIWLTMILFAWTGAAVISWGSWINASHPANYYVGGIGLQRALVDFGPMLLGCFAAAALIPHLTQLRIARPWPGILLLRDRQYPSIVAEIDRRRIAALRAMARPDPLLHPQEQVQVLDELLEAGALSEEEHAAAVEMAELAFGAPALDQPMDADPAIKNERLLH